MKHNDLKAFFIIAFLFNISASFVHPVTPTLIIERGLDSSMFGVAFAAMMLMNFLFSPFWGQLCSYTSTKRVLLVSCLGYALGQCVFSIAQSELIVILGRMLAGIFIGGCYTALTNYTVNLSHRDITVRGTNLVILSTVQSVGGACGYFIGGMLGIISVMTAFISQIIVLSLSGILFYIVCADDREFREVSVQKLTLQKINPFTAMISAKKFMTPMLALVFAIVAISAIGQNSYEQCFNYFIKDQYGMNSVWNGGIKAAIAVLILILNTTVSMYLLRKTDVNRTFRYVLCAATLLTGAALLGSNKYLFVGIFIIYSSVIFLRLPMLQTMAVDNARGEYSNQVMGFYQSMDSLGGIFGALFAGLIYGMNVYAPFILALAAFFTATMIGAVYYRKYKKK